MPIAQRGQRVCFTAVTVGSTWRLRRHVSSAASSWVERLRILRAFGEPPEALANGGEPLADARMKLVDDRVGVIGVVVSRAMSLTELLLLEQSRR